MGLLLGAIGFSAASVGGLGNLYGAIMALKPTGLLGEKEIQRVQAMNQPSTAPVSCKAALLAVAVGAVFAALTFSDQPSPMPYISLHFASWRCRICSPYFASKVFA